MMVRAVMSCLRALSLARAFPLSVLGPVLFCALRRLAWICAAVTMDENSPVGVDHREDGGDLNHEGQKEHQGKHGGGACNR